MDTYWHVLAIVKTASVSAEVRVSSQVIVLSGCVSRSGAPGSYSSSSCSFLRTLYSVSTVAAQFTFSPHLFYPFGGGWTLRLLSCLNCCERAAVNTGESAEFWIRALSSSVFFFEDIIFICYFYAFMYYFYVVNFGCAGSELLGRLFSRWGVQERLSGWAARASHWGAFLVAGSRSRSQQVQ